MPRFSRRAAAVLTAATTAAVLAPAASATPPGIPSVATAQSELNGLTVANESSASTYDRDLFPHWSAVSGTCNARETVLKRDGTSVVTDSACASTSGRWYSEYDGTTLSSSSSVDIDHVIPLAEAWRSGASGWSTSRRESFANDVTNPQLIAVSASSNRSKGDQDPTTWQPTRTAYRCTYARMWIDVKHEWSLRLQSAEKSALQGMLNAC